MEAALTAATSPTPPGGDITITDGIVEAVDEEASVVAVVEVDCNADDDHLFCITTTCRSAENGETQASVLMTTNDATIARITN
jgi:hypothetical protein